VVAVHGATTCERSGRGTFTRAQLRRLAAAPGIGTPCACQDVEFDRQEGLHSVPARFGIATALRAARVFHAVTALALAAVGLALGLGVLYWVGWLAVAGLLVYEHLLVSATDLSRLDVAFFNVNGYISVITFVAAGTGLWY
jgi:4-hydroxybenzoate polyprenyltransferase